MTGQTKPDAASETSTFLRFRDVDLIAYCSLVLQRLDVPAEDAHHVSECLVYADLRGVDSHGVIRLPVYTKRVVAGVVNPRPNMRIEVSQGAAALLNADNGLGPVAGVRAMKTALSMAKSSGIAFVGVRSSNHFGAAGYYVEEALRSKYIGCTITNAPPNMAPFGGMQRFLGTNPMAFGVPAGNESPILFDASTSVTARGKIIVAAQRNQPIPEGWAIDAQGRPTTDAARALAGAVLPFGGPKGAAISFLIDIFCGVLTGAAFALHLSTLENLTAVQNLGHVFVALRTDLFLPQTEFERRMDEILGMLRSSPPAPGVPRVVVPGEPEAALEKANRLAGVPLSDETIQELVKLGDGLDVAFPLPCAGKSQ